MKGKWIKRGLVYSPDKNKGWSQKYSILPTPFYQKGRDYIRVYYGSTDAENFGRVGYVDVSSSDPSCVLRESNSYVLDIGQLGTFDDCGVVPSCVIDQKGELLLYTVGFQRTCRTPYMLFAGLAASQNNGGSFQRVSEAPLLKRESHRHISQGAPCVIYHDGKYKMWHWFATKWIEVSGKLFMDYHIGYAESPDGKEWKMLDKTCLAPEKQLGEFAVARPWVIHDGELFHMWYSTRYVDRLYRISYAQSKDGLHWEKKLDQAPFEVSENGWDSEMICYPSVINVNEKIYMFYNGNDNGATGFGYAELISDES